MGKWLRRKVDQFWAVQRIETKICPGCEKDFSKSKLGRLAHSRCSSHVLHCEPYKFLREALKSVGAIPKRQKKIKTQKTHRKKQIRVRGHNAPRFQIFTQRRLKGGNPVMLQLLDEIIETNN